MMMMMMMMMTAKLNGARFVANNVMYLLLLTNYECLYKYILQITNMILYFTNMYVDTVTSEVYMRGVQKTFKSDLLYGLTVAL